MAKSRARVRRASARKNVSRARKRATTRRKLRRVDLKPAYKQAKSAVMQLRRFEQRRDVAQAIARLNRCMKEIAGLCPSNMIILEPRPDM